MKNLKRLAVRQGWMAMTATAPIVLAGWLLVPWLVRSFLPAYAPGIWPTRIAMTAPIFLCFGQGFANALNVTDHQYRYVLAIVLAILVNSGLSVVFVHYWGLVGVALATSTAFAVFAAGLVLVGLKFMQSET